MTARALVEGPSRRAAFPGELRSWQDFARTHGIAAPVEALRAWRIARLEWLAAAGYADRRGRIDWLRLHHEHPEARRAPKRAALPRSRPATQPTDSTPTTWRSR